MINPKYVGIAAGVGFIFTFLIGLFSGVSFAHVLLRSLIGAVVFCALCVGIMFLFQKFLLDTSVSDIDTPAKATETGGLVNITIDDDALKDEDFAPRFTVTNPRAVVGDTVEKAPVDEPVSSVETTPTASAPNASAPNASEKVDSPDDSKAASAESSFVPLNLANVAAAPAASAPVEKKAAVAESAPSVHSASVDRDALPLDELPDISDMAVPDKKDGGREVISDSDFASGGDEPMTRGAHLHSDFPAPTEQNSAMMAQAIQTLLARD